MNNTYRELLMSHGLIISGTSPDRRLVEMIELPDHPYFVGCQFHPEFKSRPQNAGTRCSARSSPRRSVPGPTAGEARPPSAAPTARAFRPAPSALPGGCRDARIRPEVHSVVPVAIHVPHAQLGLYRRKNRAYKGREAWWTLP